MDHELSIITGAGRGIGKEIALRLAKENHNVVIVSRSEDQLKKVQDEITLLNVDCNYFVGDVADSGFANNVVKETINKYSRINHLINNAGIGIFKKVIDAKLEEFQRQINTNLYGIFNFSKAVLPTMIKNQSGSIINISSLAGKNSFVGGAMYSSSKHAVMGFARSLMLEVREYNIRVSTICPGSVETRFASEDSNVNPASKKYILHSSDVAEMVIAILKLPPRALASEIDLRPTNPQK